MFITLKQVKEYVEQAEPGSTVGYCGNPFHCLIAKAALAKYPDCSSAWVSLDSDKNVLHIKLTRVPGHDETVTTGDDGQKLFELAKRFDELEDEDENEWCLGYKQVAREEALELFK